MVVSTIKCYGQRLTVLHTNLVCSAFNVDKKSDGVRLNWQQIVDVVVDDVVDVVEGGGGGGKHLRICVLLFTLNHYIVSMV